MTAADLIETRRVLERFGEEAAFQMRETLTETRQRRTGDGRLRSLRGDTVATGSLLRSVRWEIVTDGRTLELEFPLADHWEFVEYGRRPGRMPPIGPIRDWLRVRGLPESMAFPVARRIGRDGIAARPFVRPAVTDRLEQLALDLADAYASDLARYIGAR